MIKAIIFDCFGVLASEEWDRLCDKYFSESNEKQLEATKLMNQVNSAKISYDDFENQVAKLAGIDKNKVRQMLDENTPNEALFDYIKTTLKPKFKIGLLSNSGSDWLSELFSPDQLSLIDDFVLSFEVGLIKPDKEIFKLSANRLGVEPEEAVFIDDRIKHIKGANNAGMRGIVYKNFNDLKVQLTDLLNNN